MGVLIAIFIVNFQAYASEDEPFFHELNREFLNARMRDFKKNNLTPQETFARTQAVLEYFKVPDLGTLPADFFSSIEKPQTSVERLPFLQLSDEWRHFANLPSSIPGELAVFKDRDSKTQLDFSVPIPTLSVSENRVPSSLAGLKIALDPGHMGGALWDKRTGKYVRGKNGKVLSEGVMALQIALLLEERLLKRGAQVFLTRRLLEPVTSVPYEKLDLRQFGLVELSENALTDWFLDLLQSAPPSQKLYRAFENSREVKKIFSELMRGHYFIRKEDLSARADQIAEFDPDLSLVIHLDAGNGFGKETKAYVPGAFYKEEFATLEQRSSFAWHFLNQRNWDRSVLLSRSIVQSIAKNMGVQPQMHHGSNATFVEPGVYSRNLALTRQIRGVQSFLECLFYDDPAEFEALSQEKHPFSIGGQSYPYSDRLLQIVDSIEKGILQYAQIVN